MIAENLLRGGTPDWQLIESPPDSEAWVEVYRWSDSRWTCELIVDEVARSLSLLCYDEGVLTLSLYRERLSLVRSDGAAIMARFEGEDSGGWMEFTTDPRLLLTETVLVT